jgi:hypothetical protein
MRVNPLRNRVILGAIALLVLLGCWEFRWKPQYRPLYERSRVHYQRHEYSQALSSLSSAYEIEPNAAEVVTLLGWTNLKMHRPEEAEYFFKRALHIDGDIDEARIGLAALALDSGRPVDVRPLQHILQKRPGDPDVIALLAGAHRQIGDNSAAANLYRRLLPDENYGAMARRTLEEIFGLEGFSDPIPAGFKTAPRPESPQARFRAAEGAMWRLVNGAWQKHYIAGVNLSPAAPGYFPAAPPLDGRIYATYLQQVEQLNANVVRIYTLLPPSFYRAFKHAGAAGSNLLLYQQIWIGEPPQKDLFAAEFLETSKAEIRYVVDAIHGQGDVPKSRARPGGLYTEDIADRVGAILLGRNLEPSTVLHTNARHPEKTGYAGAYVSVQNANATEVWFAQMLDYLVAYQLQRYNWQHPVAVVNWPALDPLAHPTEATLQEEARQRIARGEKTEIPQGPQDDEDAASIDEAKFRAMPAFQAGLFASYHVYPYYPDFLAHDPGYLSAADRAGQNSLAGYLKELRARLPLPLVIGEYGLPASMGVSHFHPAGWHHGGHSEDAQAEMLLRLSQTIRDSGCAGGIVFELHDEWYKQNWLTKPFERPFERNSLWLNELNPEQRFGLVGFRTSKWRLFTGAANAWETEPALYDEGGARLQAAMDEGFLYLRLAGACADCIAPSGKPKGQREAYAFAIGTLPNAGAEQMPFGSSIAGGANFLLVLDGAQSARLLVAENYNPYQITDKPGRSGETELTFRRFHTPTLQAPGSFAELSVETNRQRFGRDGKVFPPRRYSRSALVFGNGDPAAKDYNSLAEWFADPANGTILVRIPWGKLLVTDPSSRQVFAGLDGSAALRTAASPGIAVTLFRLAQNPTNDLTSMQLLASFPKAQEGKIVNPAILSWKPWNKVNPETYLKKSYYALQKEFRIQAGNGVVAAGHAANPRNGPE